jgi:Ca2+-binding EF-hand superfamily protein
VKFDAFLVTVSYLAIFIEPILRGQANIPLGSITIFKMFRFFRLLRAARLVAQFRLLWQLVRGLVSSINLIFSTCILMTCIFYVYSCIGVELITKEIDFYDGETQSLIAFHFGSVPDFMVTLIQFTTFDNAAPIYARIIQQNWSMMPFFVSFMLVVGIALMNTLTAIIVEGSIEMTKHDKDVQQLLKVEMYKKFLPKLLVLFKELDVDGSGDISHEEIRDAPQHVKDELGKLLGEKDVEMIFLLLDFDGSGQIGIAEFFDSVTKIVTGNLTMNEMRVQQQISSTSNRIRESIEVLEMKIDAMAGDATGGIPNSKEIDKHGSQSPTAYFSTLVDQ